MSDRIARRLFDGLLEESCMDQRKVYDLFRALERTSYIDGNTIRITHEEPYAPLTLMAKYIGRQQIGNARVSRRRVNPDIVQNVIEIYEDISRRSGVHFTRVAPALDDPDCIGYAVMGTGDESLLALLLTGR